jgi:hypothetical protein
MHMDAERQLRAAHEPLSIVVNNDTWDLYVFGVTRVHRDWWVQIAVVGPRACTVTVRVDAAHGRGAAAHEIITLVTAWLLEDETSDHAYLEHAPLEARAS